VNIRQLIRRNWPSNGILKSFGNVVDHCCYAWSSLAAQPWEIMSIVHRNWAVVGH